MPNGVNFMQLEGNYVVSFRDMGECLPAFTAVKLDRVRGDAQGSAATLDVTGSVGNLSNLSNLSSSGWPADVCPRVCPRRRSAATPATHKLVVTGMPRGVPEDLIKARLESVIPGIDRVYRDPDMARELSHPPVFLETRLAMALDAFMLRADWVPEVQRLIREAGKPDASVDEGLGRSVTSSALSGPNLDVDDRLRRSSLVDTLVACPHGRYRAQLTCPVCRHERRNTMLADDIVGHNLASLLEHGRKGSATPSAVSSATVTTTVAAADPPAKPQASSSCMSCLRRVFCCRERETEVDDASVTMETVVAVKVIDVPYEKPAKQPSFQKNATNKRSASPRTETLLDPRMLSAINCQRRMSAYADMPAINVEHVDDLK